MTMTDQPEPHGRVYKDRPYIATFGGMWWAASCRVCRRIVSRYDATEDEARDGLIDHWQREHGGRDSSHRRNVE